MIDINAEIGDAIFWAFVGFLGGLVSPLIPQLIDNYGKFVFLFGIAVGLLALAANVQDLTNEQGIVYIAYFMGMLISVVLGEIFGTMAHYVLRTIYDGIVSILNNF